MTYNPLNTLLGLPTGDRGREVAADYKFDFGNYQAYVHYSWFENECRGRYIFRLKQSDEFTDPFYISFKEDYTYDYLSKFVEREASFINVAKDFLIEYLVKHASLNFHKICCN